MYVSQSPGGLWKASLTHLHLDPAFTSSNSHITSHSGCRVTSRLNQGIIRLRVLANKSDVIYPLNRAAAYSTLGKYVFNSIYVLVLNGDLVDCSLFWRRNEDAKRDCTQVLELSPNNVKTLFRRSQTKFGMGNDMESTQRCVKVPWSTWFPRILESTWS